MSMRERWAAVKTIISNKYPDDLVGILDVQQNMVCIFSKAHRFTRDNTIEKLRNDDQHAKSFTWQRDFNWEPDPISGYMWDGYTWDGRRSIRNLSMSKFRL